MALAHGSTTDDLMAVRASVREPCLRLWFVELDKPAMPPLVPPQSTQHAGEHLGVLVLLLNLCSARTPSATTARRTTALPGFDYILTTTLLRYFFRDSSQLSGTSFRQRSAGLCSGFLSWSAVSHFGLRGFFAAFTQAVTQLGRYLSSISVLRNCASGLGCERLVG